MIYLRYLLSLLALVLVFYLGYRLGRPDPNIHAAPSGEAVFVNQWGCTINYNAHSPQEDFEFCRQFFLPPPV